MPVVTMAFKINPKFVQNDALKIKFVSIKFVQMQFFQMPIFKCPFLNARFQMSFV